MNKTRELPTEIWDSIFFASNDGLTGSDKVMLSKSSPVFEAVLRRKLLEECVTTLIPVVAPYLAQRDLLMLRHTCKGLKQRVEELEESRFGSSILASLQFGDDDQRWTELTRIIEKQGGNGTLGRWLSLTVKPEMELENDKAVEFFQTYGHRIINLKLRVEMDCAESLRNRLVHYLKFCGNLRRLQLFPDIILSTDNRYHDIRMRGELFNPEVYERPTDPIELPFLTELQMCSRTLEMAENGENRELSFHPNVHLFFEKIVCSNLGKLTKMEISESSSVVLPSFFSTCMPSPSFVTDFNTVFESRDTVQILRILQSKGAKLKKLTLRDRLSHLARNYNESKTDLANYFQGAVTLRTLSLQFRGGFAFFAHFPPLKHEFNSSVRSLILRNAIFPNGKGLKNLGKFKSLYKLQLSYDDNAERYDFTPDTNNIFDRVPNIRQVSLKSFNAPTVYSINHHKPT